MSRPYGVLAASALLLALLMQPLSAEELYQPCITCHGDVGQGDVTTGAPALAGQDEAYLARQLRNFRDGVRGAVAGDDRGMQMSAMAVPLSDSDISALAAYLSELNRPPTTVVEGNLRNGMTLYQGNCGACHGPAGEGNPSLNAPALAWLDGAYIQRQINNFQQGLRGRHRGDRYGRQMNLMAKGIESRDLDDIIAHMRSRTRD
ncbi:c-type cytochrome [Candidatus Marimicrobium litorale]|uniref:C-type cytochrome n=1 Tax=Candidatus Marimicrobium litorale TaxID=2518991 RepID=A0ABT3T194_9GAMM|nr:c-type cytochrome [Candidatus Marimicrobium litorale]MCX2976028.1 c-type cytochrome [Candidatus Marimicrobium litorale]